ncbi:MAG: tetratricopeptide repeat protein [bacterium]|nr:tetratricopeptide repeat protein [bacterium]
MNITLSVVIYLLCLFVAQTTAAQTKGERAYELIQSAIVEMDNGNPDKAIVMLRKAQALDPQDISITYEIAYAYYLKKDYKQAIKLLSKLTSHKDDFDQIHQLLGNSYYEEGKLEKAIEVFDAGRIKFLKSGCLHLARGTVERNREEYDKAIQYFERGIQVEPAYVSNYLHAAEYYYHTPESVWAMIYGELFLNLEPKTPRTIQISKQLYDTYKADLIVTTKDSISVSFSKKPTMTANELSNAPKNKISFETVYKSIHLQCLANESEINLSSVNRMRKSFIERYFGSGFDKSHPNILFDYQKRVLDAGHFEAYNYELLKSGNQEEYETWKAANPRKNQEFAVWTAINPLVLDEQHKFYRLQY